MIHQTHPPRRPLGRVTNRLRQALPGERVTNRTCRPCDGLRPVGTHAAHRARSGSASYTAVKLHSVSVPGRPAWTGEGGVWMTSASLDEGDVLWIDPAVYHIPERPGGFAVVLQHRLRRADAERAVGAPAPVPARR